MLVHIIDSENRPSPPLALVSRFCYQVDESVASFKTGKRRTGAAVLQLKSKFSVEFDGRRHVTDGEGDCTDVLDHSGSPPSLVFPEYNQLRWLRNAGKAEVDGFYRFPSFEPCEGERCQQGYSAKRLLNRRDGVS